MCYLVFYFKIYKKIDLKIIFQINFTHIIFNILVRFFLKKYFIFLNMNNILDFEIKFKEKIKSTWNARENIPAFK